MTGGFARRGARASAAIAAAVVLVLGLTACSSDGDGGDGGGSGGPPDETTTTTAAPQVEATSTGEQTINPGYRQGLASLPDGGWIFSGTTVLARTDEALEQQVADTTAVPDQFLPDGYNHVGDVDVADGVLYVPLEQPEYQRDEQVMACFDPETLTYVDSQTVAQRHNSFIAVEGELAYSMKGFSGDQILIYRVGESCTFEPLEPLQMSARVDRVQGADVADGALWLATDDAERALYRVDLDTGTVAPIGAMSDVADEGEGEGIDATVRPSGLLHVVNIVDTLDVRLEHFEVAEVG
ncbi:MAG: hypothetical protein JNK12_14310 [Acidimicrobiales bacterium]|nr:hypothetical protein [Acidimicrobiales bacterium]